MDSNSDGVINALDPAFANLVVWQDANDDDVVEPGEVETLAQAGIASISLAAAPSNQSINGDVVEETATVTMADGTTCEIADVAFAAPPVTAYSGGAPINPAAAALPELQGYGNLIDLQGAMTQDPQLLSLVQNSSPRRLPMSRRSTAPSSRRCMAGPESPLSIQPTAGWWLRRLELLIRRPAWPYYAALGGG
ncbi:MAG: hypothetical protein ACRED9_00145 [Caulobacteraceae bacterium]